MVTAIGENGWKIIGLLRLNPLVPFSISNYLFGITATPVLALPLGFGYRHDARRAN